MQNFTCIWKSLSPAEINLVYSRVKDGLYKYFIKKGKIGMNRLKRIISKITVICLCATCVSALPCAASDEDNYSLQNSGFELPSISDSYQQPLDSSVPNWSTTAYEKKIELLRENTNVHIKGQTLTPKAGFQAAELNADEQSSLYQSIKTTPGSFVKWGISHHGRNGYDTMLLVIGPKQAVDPAKKTKTGYDQFMKMGQYIKGNSELSGLIPSADGASQEIILYSPEFADGGSFVTGEDASFTTYKTETNTEQWHIWFIRSNNDRWYDYGTNVTADTSALGYNNVYEVPENQTDTTFAFTAYESAAKSDGKVDLTYGNIIDDINFGLLYNVSLHTLTGGSANITAENTADLSVSYKDKNFDSGKYKADTVVTLTVTPDDAADYVFTGASINGTLYDYDDFAANSDNTVYTMDITVDEAKYARVTFARKGHILYDPNGGSYKGTTGITDQEYSYYTNGITESEVPAHASAAFTGWTLYTNIKTYTGITIPANHVVEYNAEDVSSPTLTLSWKDSLGNAQSVTLPATKEDGILLVANYNFKHEVIALTEGGSVDIENSTKEQTVIGDDTYKTTAGGEGDTITVSANPAAGYQFDGWFEDETGDAISKALQYSYVVTGNSKIYAKFSEKLPEPPVIPDIHPKFDSNFAYIYGYSDDTMAADNNLLRSEVSAMVHRLVKQNNKLGGFVYNEADEPAFDDIEGEWFRSGIEYMNYKGAFADNSSVYPYVSVTRGETFKIICLGLDFTDKTNLSYDDYASILYNAGYIQGDENGNLNIWNLITRAEFCTIYNKIIGRENAKLVTADGIEITPETYGFTDLDESKWYYETMLRATSAYDDEGYVDIELRNHRNVLDDYQ